MNTTATKTRITPDNTMIALVIVCMWADVIARWRPQFGYGVVLITVVGMIVCMCHSVAEKPTLIEKLLSVTLFVFFVSAAAAFSLFSWMMWGG